MDTTTSGTVSNTLLGMGTTECRYCHEFGHTVSRCSNILNTTTSEEVETSGSNRRYMKPQYTRMDSSNVYMLYVSSEQDRSDIKEMNRRIGKLKGKSWADDQ